MSVYVCVFVCARAPEHARYAMPRVSSVRSPLRREGFDTPATSLASAHRWEPPPYPSTSQLGCSCAQRICWLHGASQPDSQPDAQASSAAPPPPPTSPTPTPTPPVRPQLGFSRAYEDRSLSEAASFRLPEGATAAVDKLRLDVAWKFWSREPEDEMEDVAVEFAIKFYDANVGGALPVRSSVFAGRGARHHVLQRSNMGAATRGVWYLRPVQRAWVMASAACCPRNPFLLSGEAQQPGSCASQNPKVQPACWCCCAGGGGPNGGQQRPGG